jgi:hypothetical protein
VDATRSDIGGNERIQTPSSEVSKRTLTLTLASIAVNSR